MLIGYKLLGNEGLLPMKFVSTMAPRFVEADGTLIENKMFIESIGQLCLF